MLAFMRPETLRIVLFVLIAGGYLVYHLVPLLRRGYARIARRRAAREEAKAKVEAETKVSKVEVEERGWAPADKKRILPPSPSPSNFDFTQPRPQPLAPTSPRTGEDLFDEARAIPHRPIPNFELDGRYLDLLGKSASLGYAPALAKLGEYAMRRSAWVEAYYWMTMARRSGMHGLSPTLREIRQNWARAGFSDEPWNVNMLFSVESGSLARALLHFDSGYDAAPAREFLKSHYPDFLGEAK